MNYRYCALITRRYAYRRRIVVNLLRMELESNVLVHSKNNSDCYSVYLFTIKFKNTHCLKKQKVNIYMKLFQKSCKTTFLPYRLCRISYPIDPSIILVFRQNLDLKQYLQRLGYK